MGSVVGTDRSGPSTGGADSETSSGEHPNATAASRARIPIARIGCRSTVPSKVHCICGLCPGDGTGRA